MEFFHPLTERHQLPLEWFIVVGNLSPTMNTPIFPCTRCGLCCEHLELNPMYAELNRGDGVCKYFDAEKRACSIYETRPALCRVDESYPLFAQKMSLEEYHLANWQACQALMVRFGTDFNHQKKGK